MFVTLLNLPVLLLASIFSIFDLLPFLGPASTPAATATPIVEVVEPTATPLDTPTAVATATFATVEIGQAAQASRSIRPSARPSALAGSLRAVTATPAAPSPTATPRLFPTNREVGILRPVSTPTAAPYTGQKLSAAVPSRIARWESEIRAAADIYKLDPNLIAALMNTESSGDASAVSGAGAVGLLQVMDGPEDPRENVLLGTRMLVNNLQLFDEDLELALAAYNAGPRNVLRYKGVPPFDETRLHIARTLASYERYRGGVQLGRPQAGNNAS